MKPKLPTRLGTLICRYRLFMLPINERLEVRGTQRATWRGYLTHRWRWWKSDTGFSLLCHATVGSDIKMDACVLGTRTNLLVVAHSGTMNKTPTKLQMVEKRIREIWRISCHCSVLKDPFGQARSLMRVTTESKIWAKNQKAKTVYWFAQLLHWLWDSKKRMTWPPGLFGANHKTQLIDQSRESDPMIHPCDGMKKFMWSIITGGINKSVCNRVNRD